MYERVLIPLDGSELAEEALPHGIALAQRFGATVLLLRVIPKEEVVTADEGTGMPLGPELQTPSELRRAEAAHREEAERYLGTIAHRLQGQGLAVETEVGTGAPAEQILASVTEQDIDLIVICTHGRSGIARFAFGSIADEVIRKSGHPVLVIRPAH